MLAGWVGDWLGGWVIGWVAGWLGKFDKGRVTDVCRIYRSQPCVSKV